ncbi:MAG TPA: DUF935 family protein [Limnochordia bacterium]|nr:DUF935 family protein [Limnochordia bacterium]
MALIDAVRKFAARVAGVPLGEASTSGQGPYYDFEMQPYNPDSLVGQKGLGVYDKMLTDDQIKASLTLKKIALLKSGWDIEPASEDQADIDVAEYVRYVLEHLSGTFERDLLEIMTALDYGYSVSEIVWEIIAGGPYKGKVGIQAIKTRRPHGWQFVADKHNNLRQLVQHTADGDLTLDPAKFAIYTYGGQWGNHYGRSDLREAYRAWWSKDFIIKAWNIFLDKYGQPTPIGKYAQGAKPTDITKLETVLDSMQTASSITLPEGLSIELLEAMRGGQAGYEAAIDKYDKMIARALLLPEMMGFVERSGGSYNLGEHQFDLFGSVIEFLGGEIAESVVNEQLVRRLVDYNFTVDKYPRFHFNSFFGEDPKAEAEVLKTAEDIDLFFPGKLQKDMDHGRAKLGLPKLEEEDLAALEEAKQEAQPPPPPPNGGQQQPDAAAQPNGAAFAEGDGVHRALTFAEKKVDFAEIKREADAAEAKAVTELSGVVAKMRDKLKGSIAKAWPVDVNEIDGLQVQHVGEFRTALASFMASTYEQGRKDVAAEIAKVKGAPKVAAMAETPVDEEFLKRRAFYIAGVERDYVLKQAKQILFQALETGATQKETMFALDQLFAQYVEVAGDVTTPSRLETVVRTNWNNAYNAGRREFMAQPELKEFVPAVEYSAVLDSRTTPFCRSWDGKILSKTNPAVDSITPPNHFNCRSILVPVTSIEIEDQAAEGKPVPIDGDLPSAKPHKGFGKPGVEAVGPTF